MPSRRSPRAPFERSPISSGDARSLAASAPPRALLCVGSQWDCPLPCISLVEVCWRQSIHFSLSRNVFISRGLSKDVFARPRNLSWSLFSFSAVETPLHRPLNLVFVENAGVFLLLAPESEVSYFPLWMLSRVLCHLFFFCNVTWNLFRLRITELLKCGAECI